MDYHSERTGNCRIFEFHHRGGNFLSVENDCIRLTIWLDKGTDIVEIRYKPLDLNLMWASPVGLRDITRQIPTVATPRGNNNDYYPGGWHEALPGGGPYEEGGNFQGLHGEVSLMPWTWRMLRDDVEEAQVEFSCTLVRMPLKVIKVLTIKQNTTSIYFEETLVNLSRDSLSFMWGHHPTFGKPFVGPQTKLFTSATRFHVAESSPNFASPYTASVFEPGSTHPWPIGKGKNGKGVDLSIFPPFDIESAEMLYLEVPIDGGWFALCNRELDISAGIVWDATVFPAMWYWKNLYGLHGYPWYGEGYNIGLEFWTGWPNYEECKRKNTLMRLNGYEEVSTHYVMHIWKGSRAIQSMSFDGPGFSNV